jgi:voltage-gated sodium channel type IV alpha
MNLAVNSKGPLDVPGFKENPYISLFFLVFIIFGAFFIINLFVGVIISAYNREIDKND